jgi:hypothetical protein
MASYKRSADRLIDDLRIQQPAPKPWAVTLRRNLDKSIDYTWIYTDHGSDWLFGPDGKPIIHFRLGEWGEEDWYEFTEADGFLIHAAPELLAACEALVAAEDDADVEMAVDMARAAIAKARGDPRFVTIHQQ